MVFEGCHGKPRTPTIHEKICPQCGEEMYNHMMEIAAVQKHKKEKIV